MKHQVKVVIGANYGDEGKGLISRYFTKNFKEDGNNSVTVFHNGSAQRGHTVDYESGKRHIFHNFGAGTMDGGITYYANSFMVHPMDFCREIGELGFTPKVYCHPNCVVVTPFDMMADHVIEDYIEQKCGAREYGSCGYGTWSTTERICKRPDIAYTVSDFANGDYYLMMLSLYNWARERVTGFGVDLDAIPSWKKYFDFKSGMFSTICRRFKQDILTFLKATSCINFSQIWEYFDSVIFEGAQGLMLDKCLNSDWTTTSNTGLKNPSILLSKYRDFDAEVCYVTRSYLTRHGDGPLNNEAIKESVGDISEDMTNITNPYQGRLRYAPLDIPGMEVRIAADFMYANSGNYRLTTAITHCNEVDCAGGDYRSYSPSKVEKT